MYSVPCMTTPRTIWWWWRCSVQYTVQFTEQYSTVQYSTVQYSTCYTVYTVQDTKIISCPRTSWWWWWCSVQYTVQFTVHCTVHSTLYSSQYTMYTAWPHPGQAGEGGGGLPRLWRGAAGPGLGGGRPEHRRGHGQPRHGQHPHILPLRFSPPDFSNPEFLASWTSHHLTISRKRPKCDLFLFLFKGSWMEERRPVKFFKSN